MKNIIIEANDTKYLIRYKVIKSVVSRKHTVKSTGKVISRLEKHPVACEVYLYQINTTSEVYIGNLLVLDLTRKQISQDVKDIWLTYLGRGLSKCSDKDTFNLNTGIRCAISNIEDLDTSTKHNINYKLLNNEL